MQHVHYIEPANVGYKREVLTVSHSAGLHFQLNGRSYFLQQSGQVSPVDLVAGTDDCAALRMSQHRDYFRSRNLTRVLHAAENVIVDDVACDADAEDVSQSLVENQFSRCAGIDAAQDGGKRELPLRGEVHLLQQVPVQLQIVQKPLVPLFQQ